MKAISPACAALLFLASACNQEDTSAGTLWRRTVEPRLSTTRSWHSCARKPLSPDRVVIETQCAAAPLIEGRCDDVVSSRDEANRILVSQPQCTNAAVAALETFARADAAAMSDLAGAYYVRAQRTDNPADLLNAFDAARRAVDMKPQPPGANSISPSSSRRCRSTPTPSTPGSAPPRWKKGSGRTRRARTARH